MIQITHTATEIMTQKEHDDFGKLMDFCGSSDIEIVRDEIDPCSTINASDTKSNDVINKPAHYNTGKIEVIDYIIDHKMNYVDGNVVKYISRAPHKGTELEDRKKAIWYAVRGLLDFAGKDEAIAALKKTLEHFEKKA